MNWRFIINTVLIILILHFVLENLDIRIDIGGTRLEGFTISSSASKCDARKLNADQSLKFLQGESEESELKEGFDPRQDILDYINNKSKDVRGLEYYKTDFNTPHFNSNLMDVHSFYNINYDNNDCTHMGFDGIDMHQLKKQQGSHCTPLGQCGPKGPVVLKADGMLTNITEQALGSVPSPFGGNMSEPMFGEIGGNNAIEGYENSVKNRQNVRPKYQSEQWNYKKELPMNGGEQEGVVGYTKIEDDFAPFPSQSTFLKPNAYQKCTGKTDDLRYERQNFED